jgi:hypothetical protein
MLVAWLLTWRSLKKPLGQERVEFVRTPKRGALQPGEPDRLNVGGGE